MVNPVINPTNNPAILLLEDGTVFRGNAAGFVGTTMGEICFNTGMTGYQEIFTDPSYFGQILVTTNAHIGNYGTKEADVESSSIKIAGLVCKNFTNEYSRPQADLDIQQYFEVNKLVGICNIDTRAVVRHIRSKGAMNAIISSESQDLDLLEAKLKSMPSMAGLELASKVSTQHIYQHGDVNSRFKVAVMDYGCKSNILRNLASRDCYMTIFPAKTSWEEIKEEGVFDGYFLSNGPGDPASMDYAVDLVKKIVNSGTPTFGICLGHQLLALSQDVPTYKMHTGHRGINHPVKNLDSGHCEITSQNHGFGVDASVIRSKEDLIEVTHVNLNDDTIEGIRLKGKPVFSVQYHPESSPGPYDSRYLFDQFVALMAM